MIISVPSKIPKLKILTYQNPKTQNPEIQNPDRFKIPTGQNPDRHKIPTGGFFSNIIYSLTLLV
ncbi:15386_t:CDS:2 [Funneliformis geosporum]|nr:15386_t:CDS:2 [Funneliformis geosporum]